MEEARHVLSHTRKKQCATRAVKACMSALRDREACIQETRPALPRFIHARDITCSRHYMLETLHAMASCC